MSTIKEINHSILDFIRKYPFFTDPIVLFNPERIPSKEEILKKGDNLGLKYPQIDSLQENLEMIKKDFNHLHTFVSNHTFKSRYYEIEYHQRLKDFYKIIRIIECFYEEDEYEKYTLLNEYFGIEFELLDRIFDDIQFLSNSFQASNSILDRQQQKRIKNIRLSDFEIKTYFEEAIKYLDLTKNWKVNIGNVLSIVHTNFNHNGGELIIPKGYSVNGRSLLELIAHEIDGHCVQFSNCSGLFSGSIRFSKSESLVEGYAMFLEYSFSRDLFGNTKISNLFKRNLLRYKSLKDNSCIEEYLDTFSKGGFRLFRGFNDIKKYKNIKDFVYLQGIYHVLRYNQQYSNFLDLIKDGAINDSFIQKYGNTEIKKKRLDIKKTSAYHITQKLLSNIK